MAQTRKLFAMKKNMEVVIFYEAKSIKSQVRSVSGKCINKVL